ncbi:enoyl-CoA hydratase-related protein [Halorientalis marina]|jgi:methylmalonyl-CoA decarboxylase|uniref:enoyl-CoA hydratase-related protein n=1 Tax=Halorientalis marina TaxID=2931976 RepID=UPI001FF1CDD3|nr:enoyl-CoA hydratase-related protein [Halorientalis marina]
MDGTVSTETEDRIRTITFSNPAKRNALSPAMLDAFVAALDEAAEDDTRVVVVRSGADSDSFSAGFDLSVFGEGSDPDETEAIFDRFVRRLRSFDFPVVAMIDGATWGGGVELALTCDLQVASTEASFGLPPAKLGILYPARGIQRFLHVLGPSDASELLYTADPVDADRASEMGLVNDVVPPTELEARAYELAGSIASNAPRSLVGMKKIIRAFLDQSTLSPAEQEWVFGLRQEAYESDDHSEGLAAFEEDRTPEFEGQ